MISLNDINAVQSSPVPKFAILLSQCSRVFKFLRPNFLFQILKPDEFDCMLVPSVEVVSEQRPDGFATVRLAGGTTTPSWIRINSRGYICPKAFKLFTEKLIKSAVKDYVSDSGTGISRFT